ncbi:MAG: PaaI family thioesterase, partial [Hyphomonadaceae bacterium]
MTSESIDWQAIRERIDGMMQFTPHARALGLRITGVSAGKAEGLAPYRDDLVGDPDTGVIAGGVIIAFLDHLSGVAAMTALGTPTPIATLDLRIDYMRPATPGRDVKAQAHC